MYQHRLRLREGEGDQHRCSVTADDGYTDTAGGPNSPSKLAALGCQRQGQYSRSDAVSASLQGHDAVSVPDIRLVGSGLQCRPTRLLTGLYRGS